MRSGEESKAQRALPPSIIMHSFAGTVGGMESLLSNKGRKGNLQERLYFSFSKIVNMRAPKTIDVRGPSTPTRRARTARACGPSRLIWCECMRR
jgi:Tat protein secretion system quality control protein TatD with DNase activity